ncbi:glycosyl hydrolase 2 galactose-binding domain-containing protein [Micromonospora sp. NPDC051300]|uniref:glycoside hydrolase family 2 protein n=1 Tax=Micromonospora sp. NPDC051300 TaxID=3364286 RepID=UPI0037985CDC
MVTTHDLGGTWSLRMITAGEGAPALLTDAPISGQVPGCVHLDLLAAGLIPDPYLDDHEDRLHWVGTSTWRYDHDFHLPADPGADRVDLVCDGLDTVAEVRLNGRTVARTRNMHRAYRWPVHHLLRAGANTLSVVFHPVDEEAARLRDTLGDLPRSYTHSYNFVRKMACNFGWDWGPDLTTAGIWRTIGLQRWHDARLARVRPLVTVDGDVGTARLVVDVERTRPTPLTLEASVAGHRAVTTLDATQTSGEVVLIVPRVRRWHPHGAGEQALYDIDLTVSDERDVLDTWSAPIGFRSVHLDTSADPTGRRFSLHVNDEPLIVRGVNWIPDDCFPSRITVRDLSERLQQARAAGVNLVRVWGGGVFESDDFYRLCDEMGLLVWQDMLFACAAYPEEPPIRDEVEAEVTDAVHRLAPHPSLVLWNGCNENIWAQRDWGWGPGTEGRTWGLGYYLELLPDLLRRLDPTRPYWPGSPFSGADDHPNDPAFGTSHLWSVWNDVDYVHYRDSVPRFVGEFGFQGPAAYATLRRAISDQPLTPRSPGMLSHQKAEDGYDKLDRSLAAHFGVPRDFDDWHFLASLNQARAIDLGIAHFRSHAPRCTGTILWQLNDCWPVTSWSVVDGDGRQKPAWYALRRAHAIRMLTVQPRAGGLAVVLGNAGRQTWTESVRVTRRRLRDGAVLAGGRLTLTAGPGQSAEAPLPPDLTDTDEPLAEFVVAETADHGRTLWFFAPDRELHYPRASFSASVTPTGDGYRVVLHAHTLLRDVTFFPDRLDPVATLDDNVVTLLSGESRTFTVRCGPLPEPRLLAAAPVLRCVNDGVLVRLAEGAPADEPDPRTMADR